jgi:hypothetical protein
VRILIDYSYDISMMLYEYAGNNPVKSVSTEEYSIRVKDRDGNKFDLTAKNYLDRLSFSNTDSKIVHNVLMKGGKVQFWIKEIDTPTTQYEFTIQNADWYDNAFKRLSGE